MGGEFLMGDKHLGHPQFTWPSSTVAISNAGPGKYAFQATDRRTNRQTDEHRHSRTPRFCNRGLTINETVNISELKPDEQWQPWSHAEGYDRRPRPDWTSPEPDGLPQATVQCVHSVSPVLACGTACRHRRRMHLRCLCLGGC